MDAVPTMHHLQRADQWLGWLVCCLLQPLRWWTFLRGSAKSPGEVRRVLIIKLWGVGSLQLLTASVRALRLRFPHAELHLLTLASNEEFARGFRCFDSVLTLEIRGAGWLTIFWRILCLLGQLRRLAFDTLFDFEFFTRFSAVLSLASGARSTNGFYSPTVWRGGFHSRVVPFNRYWHVARNFAALAGREDKGEIESSELAPFFVDDQSRLRLRLKLNEHGLSTQAPLVVLNPNAGTLSLERRWPPERFAELAARLRARLGVCVILSGTQDERDYSQAVAHEAGRLLGLEREFVVNLAGCLRPSELCALLERAQLFVSNDSGPMHLAAALGTPTIGLFGPETPLLYRPIGARARSLWRPPICSPCINVHDNKRSTCIHGRPECLMNLSVDEVEKLALSMVEPHPVPMEVHG